MIYDTDAVFQKATPISISKGIPSTLGESPDFIKSLAYFGKLGSLYTWNHNHTLPQGKYLTKVGDLDENFVVFDFNGELTGFNIPITAPLIWTPLATYAGREEKLTNIERSLYRRYLFLAQNYGEFFIMKALNLPVVYTTYDTLPLLKSYLTGQRKAYSPKIILIENRGSKDSFIDTLELETAGIPYAYSKSLISANSFTELYVQVGKNPKLFLDKIFQLFAGYKVEDRLKVFLPKDESDESKEAKLPFVIDEVDGGHGYTIAPQLAPAYKFLNFHIQPEHITSDANGNVLWHVKIRLESGVALRKIIDPSKVFVSPEKFATFALSNGGLFTPEPMYDLENLPPEEEDDEPETKSKKYKKSKTVKYIKPAQIILSFYSYLSKQFPKRLKPITKLGYDIVKQELVYPGHSNARYESKEVLYPHFTGLYPTVFSVPPKNIRDFDSMRESLHKIFLSAGYAHPDWSKEKCHSVVAPAIFIWAIATHYSPFVMRDYSAFPGFNIFGDPSSGKSFLFEMLATSFGLDPHRIVKSASSGNTIASIQAIISYFNSGFFIVDELTKENSGPIYKYLMGLYRNANNGAGRTKMDTSDNKTIIEQTANCPIAIGGEVEAEDKAARSRSLSFSMPSRVEFSPEVLSIEPIAQGYTKDIQPYIHYLLSNVNEMSWQAIRTKIEGMKKFIRKRSPNVNSRVLKNWSILLGFSHLFLESEKELKDFAVKCLSNLIEIVIDTGAGHFATVLELGLTYILLLKDFDRANVYREHCSYSKVTNRFNFRAEAIRTCAELQRKASPTEELAIHSASQMKSSAWECPYVVKNTNKSKTSDWNHVGIKNRPLPGSTSVSGPAFFNVVGYSIDLDKAPDSVVNIIRELEHAVFREEIVDVNRKQMEYLFGSDK